MYADDQVDDPVLAAIRRRKATTPIPDAGTGGPIYAPVDPLPTVGTGGPDYGKVQPTNTGTFPAMTTQADRSITDPTIPQATTNTEAPIDKGYGQQSAQVGHDGVAPNGMTREQWRDAWMSSGVRNKEQALAWLAQNGGQWVGDNGTISTPFGETGDLLIGARTGNGQPGWTFANAGGGGGGGTGGGGTGTSGGSSFQDETRRLLMEQIAAMSKPVTADDPAIKGELQSQQRSIERNRMARRGADAERAAFQGLLNGGQSSGAFDTNIASGFEDAGSQFSDVQTQLFSRELSARRDKLSGLLATAVQSGDNESARALQLQIAEMDAELRRQQMAQQQSQHNDDYGLSSAELQYQRDRDAARARAGLGF